MTTNIPVLTAGLTHALSGHWRTVLCESEPVHVGQDGCPVSHIAEQPQSQKSIDVKNVFLFLLKVKKRFYVLFKMFFVLF